MKIFIAIFILSIISIFLIREFYIPDPTSKPSVSLLNTRDSTDSDKEKISLINSKYKDIKSISAEIDIIFKKEKTNRLNGTFECEKGRNCRLKLSSLVGNEADIGSNSEHYWYWFNRRDQGRVFYGSYETAESSDLPLNPIWLSQCFMVNPISLSGKMVSADKFSAIISKHGDLVKSTIFDLHVTKPIGYYIYDKDDKLIAFCDIVDTITVDNFELPRLINISCPEENIYMKWTIKNYKINKPINDNWKIPNYSPIILK